jgi:hypothetical protein
MRNQSGAADKACFPEKEEKLINLMTKIELTNPTKK